VPYYITTLCHFSEDPTITTFTPRPSRLERDCVWAIDEAHAPLYWFPCECPRVAAWVLAMESVGDLLEKHALHPDSELRLTPSELRLTPSLRPLWNTLTASTLHFSGIRLRNASAL
jgi:hypothetical protein